MKKLLPLFALLVLVACNSCAPQPSPVPPPAPIPDAGPDPEPTADAAPNPVPSSPEAVACANLARLGCPEGLGSQCESVLRHAVDSLITRVDLPCLTGATSQPGARACGFVRCQP